MFLSYPFREYSMGIEININDSDIESARAVCPRLGVSIKGWKHA